MHDLKAGLKGNSGYSIRGLVVKSEASCMTLCIPLPLQTFPEIIPFIEVCVKMMEQVYNVPVDIDTPTVANDRGQPSQVQYGTVKMNTHILLSQCCMTNDCV